MATFTNQAQLLYNDTVINSNVAVGELIEALSASKTTLGATYSPSDDITYVISVSNSGTSQISGVTVTDDLGGYESGETMLYPLTYKEGSAKAFVNGTLFQGMTVTASDTAVVFSDLSIPAEGSLIIIYEALPNAYAPAGADGTITNTATVTSPDTVNPITAQATVTAASEASLAIIKAIDPVPVAENGTISFTLTIQNSGNEEVPASGNAVVTDTLDPIITGLTASLDGTALVEGTGYTYDETTGAFATTEGTISIPAAQFTQNEDGTWSVTPGVTTLVISGTV